MKNGLRRQGFTLIELLVVVSIITLLISILLPAVGAARTRARVSACVQNMKQHSLGAANYAAANGDTLPNAPKAPPDDTAEPTHGLPGRTARMVATTEFPVNGFAFQGSGVVTYRPITNFAPDSMVNTSNRWDTMALSYNGYWMVMSQYMTDQEGIDAFQDVFFSPSDSQGKQIRDERSRAYIEDNDGAFPGLGTDQAKTQFRTGSYRYCTAGVLTPAAMDVNETGGAKGTPGFDLGVTEISKKTYLNDGFYRYVRRLPSSSMDYPSQKVTFFLQNAYHNSNRSSWFEPGAICPVALGDGSAQETVPDRDALDGGGNGADSTIAMKERAGSWLRLVYTIQADDPTQEDITVNYYAPYLVTRGGIRGRDL